MCSCTRSVPVPRPEEAGRCPGALRVRNSLPQCATTELFPKCTWSGPWLEALGLPEPGLGKPSLQVRLQDRGAGFRPWPPERGVLTRSCGRAWRRPLGSRVQVLGRAGPLPDVPFSASTTSPSLIFLCFSYHGAQVGSYEEGETWARPKGPKAEGCRDRTGQIFACR